MLSRRLGGVLLAAMLLLVGTFTAKAQNPIPRRPRQSAEKRRTARLDEADLQLRENSPSRRKHGRTQGEQRDKYPEQHGQARKTRFRVKQGQQWTHMRFDPCSRFGIVHRQRQKGDQKKDSHILEQRAAADEQRCPDARPSGKEREFVQKINAASQQGGVGAILPFRRTIDFGGGFTHSDAHDDGRTPRRRGLAETLVGEGVHGHSGKSPTHGGKREARGPQSAARTASIEVVGAAAP